MNIMTIYDEVRQTIYMFGQTLGDFVNYDLNFSTLPSVEISELIILLLFFFTAFSFRLR